MNAIKPLQSRTLEGRLCSRDQQIRSAQKRAIGIMHTHPEKARSITVTTGTVRDGLACDIRQGDFSLTADLGRGMGGDAAGPSPSFYARAAIASCIAIAVKMHAANEGRVFRAVSVTVETDMADLALWGIGPFPAAPCRTDIKIGVESDEFPEIVAAIVETALQRDPWYLALRDAQTVETTLEHTTVGRNADHLHAAAGTDQ